MSRLTCHLVVVTRYPRLGTGKRRLARDIGPVEALRVQRVLLRLLLCRFARDRRWVTTLAVTPDRSGPWPHSLPVLPQGRGDLGRRMAAVASRLSPGPVVIIGSDAPGIMPVDIACAFRELGRSDAVFGPAPDGGYWLVGLRRRPRFLDPFRQVRWSSEYALADTLANLSSQTVCLLRVLADMDDGAALAQQPDWYRLRPPHRPAEGKPGRGSSEASKEALGAGFDDQGGLR